eukprot:4004977-Prymnesium_polylepis.1
MLIEAAHVLRELRLVPAEHVQPRREGGDRAHAHLRGAARESEGARTARGAARRAWSALGGEGAPFGGDGLGLGDERGAATGARQMLADARRARRRARRASASMGRRAHRAFRGVAGPEPVEAGASVEAVVAEEDVVHLVLLRAGGHRLELDASRVECRRVLPLNLIALLRVEVGHDQCTHGRGQVDAEVDGRGAARPPTGRWRVGEERCLAHARLRGTRRRKRAACWCKLQLS